ncbi:MAG: HEAT repeat domain-containing protein [Planctomycetota bacterium]
MPLPADQTPWSRWWEFNKDPYLNLRQAIRSVDPVSESDDFFLGKGMQSESIESRMPVDSTISGRIVPVLVEQLESTEQANLQSACLIALAKVGRDTDSVKILDVFQRHLGSPSPIVRESATLALGISQRPAATVLLAHLVADDALGRRLLGDRGAVSHRTQSFAAFGLGLIASASDDNGVKRSAFEALRPVLLDRSIADQNLRVAAFNALSVLQPDQTSLRGIELSLHAGQALWEAWNDPRLESDSFVRAHVPVAVAKLLGDVESADHPLLEGIRARFRRSFLDVFERHSSKTSAEVSQSVALALGLMASEVNERPRLLARSDDEREELDGRTAQALVCAARDSRDQQTRFFSLLSMAKQGGRVHRDFLIRTLRKTPNRVEQGWAAISLGVLAHESRERDSSYDASVIGEALHRELRGRNETVLGAVSVALGLANHQAAEQDLLVLLDDKQSIDSLAGHVCTGLALMDSREAIRPLRDLAEDSAHRDLRLQRAAMALGRLGDPDAGSQLVDLVTEDRTPKQQKLQAVSAALSMIGDRECVDPMIDVLNDESATTGTRALAAATLGGIADKQDLPWNSVLGTDVNYRAVVETLTNPSRTGVLDMD